MDQRQSTVGCGLVCGASAGIADGVDLHPVCGNATGGITGMADSRLPVHIRGRDIDAGHSDSVPGNAADDAALKAPTRGRDTILAESRILGTAGHRRIRVLSTRLYTGIE